MAQYSTQTINVTSPLPPTLSAACTSGDLSAVERSYSSLNSSVDMSSILIQMAILAAKNAHPAILSFCFSHGLTLDPSHVNSPLIYAATDSKSIPVFQVLLDNGWDVNQELEMQGNALATACFHGNVPLVKFLLENGADPNTGMAFSNHLPLVWSLIGDNRSLEIVQLLLDHGVEVRGGGELIAAADMGNLEGMRMLLDTGRCDLEEVEEYGDYDHRKAEIGTALYMAAKEGHKEVVALLLERGARKDWTDKKGRSVVDVAREEGHIVI